MFVDEHHGPGLEFGAVFLGRVLILLEEVGRNGTQDASEPRAQKQLGGSFLDPPGPYSHRQRSTPPSSKVMVRYMGRALEIGNGGDVIIRGGRQRGNSLTKLDEYGCVRRGRDGEADRDPMER